MNRHELDPVSLTFGFVFTGLGLLFLIGRADQALRLQWVWPLLLLALGAGILLDLTRDRGRQALEPNPGVGVEGEVGSGVEDRIGAGSGVEDQVGSRSGVEDQVGSRSGVEDQVGSRSGVEDQVGSRSGVEGEEDAGAEGSVDNREHLR